METALEKVLVSRYPSLYRDYGGDIRQTCMGWGFSCGDGWYYIIDDLSFKITQIDKDKRVVADQVKEKFGGLRFYFHIEVEKQPGPKMILFRQKKYWLKSKIFYYTYPLSRYVRDNWLKTRKFFYKTLYEKVSELIDEAERKSYRTCEVCGCDGKRRGEGWITVRCDNCYDDSLKNHDPVD